MTKKKKKKQKQIYCTYLYPNVHQKIGFQQLIEEKNFLFFFVLLKNCGHLPIPHDEIFHRIVCVFKDC
jgi:hypothetical protein